MMKHQFIFLIIVSGLLCACAGKTRTLSVSAPVKTALDESRFVISSFPRRLRLIDDSTVSLIANNNRLVQYNIYSGKPTADFTLKGISLDSLLDETYNKYFNGKKQYVYDTSESGVRFDDPFQFGDYAFEEGKFYVYVTFMVQVKNSDPMALKNSSDPRLKAIFEKYPDITYTESANAEYMLTLDRQMKLENIRPLYHPSAISGNYSPCYQIGFGVKEHDLYVALLPNDWSFSNYGDLLNSNPDFHCLSKLDMKDTGRAELLFSNKEIDHSDFNFNHYLESNRCFRKTEEGYFFCNSKEICETATKEKVLEKEVIPANQWISSFWMNKDNILLKTYTLGKMKNPSKLDKAYARDSLCGDQLVFVDRQSGLSQVIPLDLGKEKGSFDLDGNRLVYIERDKEHYYISRILLHEN